MVQCDLVVKHIILAKPFAATVTVKMPMAGRVELILENMLRSEMIRLVKMD